MSTNPSNAIGTNGAYGGRTSVEALNDILNVFTGGGIIRGWECSPSSGMTVALGGVSGYRDVAIAVSPTGTRTTINNRTTSPVNVTLSTAPASNSRIDVIVAYAQNPPQGSATVVDNPAACGIIPVSGTVSSSPTAPSDSDIRSAITADGGTGSTAYYVVLATITVASGVTTITSNYITQGAKATLGTDHIADGAVTPSKISLSSVFGASMRSSSYTLTTSDTTIASVDISNFPTGSVVAVFGTLNTQNSTETAIYGNIKDNSNTVLATGTCYLNAGGAQSLSLQGVFTKTSSQTSVNLVVAKSNSSSTSTIAAKNASVSAIVVGIS